MARAVANEVPCFNSLFLGIPVPSLSLPTILIERQRHPSRPYGPRRRHGQQEMGDELHFSLPFSSSIFLDVPGPFPSLPAILRRSGDGNLPAPTDPDDGVGSGQRATCAPLLHLPLPWLPHPLIELTCCCALRPRSIDFAWSGGFLKPLVSLLEGGLGRAHPTCSAR
uniref:Uncharacterized protein n=1 Tax=Oryza meridionalis TaxID=40149 RepID=A0A0E0EXU0_9ORYZ